MFSWICPKCGREVPPSVDECPWCAPAKPPEPVPVSSGQAGITEPPAPEPQTRTASPPSAPPPAKSVAVIDEPPPQPGGLPSWLIAMGALIGIAALLAVLYLYVLPSKKTVAATTPAQATADQPAQAAPGAAAKPVHPYAKFLEITGLRVNEDNKQRAQVQFVVVNHSGADLPKLQMHVTVRSGGKSFFDFPYTVPALGPFETKDATASVKTDLKPYELPDWQFLKADFEITSTPE